MLDLEDFFLTRLRQNHQSIDNHDFVVPENALLLSFYKLGQSSTGYKVYDLTAYQPIGLLSIDEAKELEGHASLNYNYRISTSLLTQLNSAVQWQHFDEVCIIPINLLFQPKAFMVFPEQGESSYGVKYIDELSLILERSMFDYFFQRYRAENLKRFDTSQALLMDFAHEVAHWLCPNTYQVFGDRYDYRSHTLREENMLTLSISTPTEDTSTIDYFIDGDSSIKFSSTYQATRRLALQNSLTLFYELLYDHWKVILKNGNIEVLSHMVEKIQELTTELTTYKAEVEHALHRLDMAKSTQAYDNAFFEKEGLWQVYFKGKPYIKKATSEMGMLAIYVLLKNPNQLFKPFDLRDEITKITKREKKSEKNEEEPISNELKDDDITRINADYKQYNSEWQEMKHKDMRSFTLDNFNKLEAFYKLIELRLFCVKGEKRAKLLEVKEEVKKTLIALMQYGGFRDIQFLFEKKWVVRTEPQERDLLYRNIDNALNAFLNTDLLLYLEKTLVYKKTNGLKPFIFNPLGAIEDLILKPEWLDIKWTFGHE